jgi:aldehyde:ferredoxin oxidoreductase
MAGPEGDRLIRVDMTTQTVSLDPYPDEWKLVGGRGLSAKILLAECDPTCDPLGPDNVLVMAPGVMSGTAAPTSGRISIGGKSPRTGGIKEANAGGNPGQDLMKLGIRAIIVKGQPADPDKRYGLEVDESGARIVEADEYKGMWNYALCEKLLDGRPKTASVISIGPAGELKLTGASVACTDQDKERRPARHAARGGLGAVMGSKGLKWVCVDPAKARLRSAAQNKDFNTSNKDWTKAYREGPQMFKTGTSSVVPVANMLNTFPYKNRTEGQSPDAASLDGARIVESFETHGGGMHNCMTGCIVQCSNIVHDADGNYKTSALEFETLTLLGANCAIASWEDVADLDRLCDELGLDTIETGAAIAILMDSGGLDWGDAEGAKKLVREIADGTELGTAIGNGAVAIGKHRGHKRVPAVKGQAIPAWDPRPLKATGVTYAAGPMGADHTAGLIVNPGMQPDEFARASQEVQLINAVCDSSGFCQFLHDVLPECMTDEGIGPDHSLVFDVDAATIAASKVRFPLRDEMFDIKASG